MEDKIKRIIAEELGRQEDEVLLHRSLMNDLGMDELDRIELTMHIEEEFEISIPNDGENKWETVKDVIDYVTEAIKEK